MGDAVTDNLKKVWDSQLAFLVELMPDIDKLSLSEKMSRTKDCILHGQSELIELLNETQWKTWLQRSPQEPNLDSLAEEAVDVFKFIINVMLIWGVDAERFFEAFERKSEVNFNRHLQHRQLSKIMTLYRRAAGTFKVAALDLDGVLAAYPEHWLDYVAVREGVPLGEFKVEDFSLLSGPQRHSLDRARYAQLKHEYRATGNELLVSPMPGAAAFTRRLKELGYHIVIISARPVERYKRIYSDTIRWLKKHDFAYDAVIWDANKEDRIIRDLPVVAFVLEDDPVNALKLFKAKINVYLIDRPYNRKGGPGFYTDVVPRVEGFDELLAAEEKR